MRGFFRAPKLHRRRKMQVELLEARQLLATISVNTTADDTTADATLSLREAIEVSDGTLAVSSLSTQEQAQVSGAVGSTNTIDFNIPTTDPGYDPATGAWTIQLHSELPAISTNAAIIDGYSQPGSAKNTLAQADNAKLLIALNGAGGASTGLTIAAQGSKVSGLDIENFNGDGVLITAGGNVQVAGCFIGTDPTGETAAPNKIGVEIDNSNNLIGGPGVGDRNVISGNTDTSSFMVGVGVYVPDQAHNPLNITPTANVIENNFIGIDAKGTNALGNGLTSPRSPAGGVADSGSGDIYGGTAPGLGNVISGNAYGGINSTGNITVEGNYIGTDATGNVGVGNGAYGYGVSNISPSGAAITATISNNVVSDNQLGGIVLQPGSPSTSTYTIANNLIGTNASGTAALGNLRTGLEMRFVENSTITNNVISANLTGVELLSSGSTLLHDVFQGNFVGTDKTGLVALGNSDGGIAFTGPAGDVGGDGNLVGGTGPGQGNVIAFNNGPGIDVVAGGQFNTFTRNSIFNNNPGIYAPAGPTGVVPGILTFTPGSGGNGVLSGTLYEQPNQTYDVEIYSNPEPPPGGYAEGKTFVQDVTVTTDGTGTGTFSLTLPQGIYTSTATDSSGTTSGFSQAAVTTAPLPATTTAVTSSLNPSNVGQQVTFTAVVTASGFTGTLTGTVTFTIDGQAQTPVPLSVVGGVDEAQFAISTLAAGQHSVSAAYSGDTNVAASSGSLPTQTVNGPAVQSTSTVLTSSLNPSTVGQQVAFTAVVTPTGSAGAPTGTVTFAIDGQAQAPVTLSVVGGADEAQFTTSTLAAGTHTISATYNGDATFGGSTAPNPLTETVDTQTPTTNPLGTSTTVVSSTNPANVGGTVTFTATVAPVAGTGTPTGSITFIIDGMAEPPVPLRATNGRDQATFSIATLTPGMHTIGATYGGDATFAASGLMQPLMQAVVTTTRPATVPPTVVSLKRYGIHCQPTVLTITFSAAMDPARAQNINNYQIIRPCGRHVRIRSVSYDPATKTVTLQPRRRINLHRTYWVEVMGAGAGGVADSHDVALDGADNGKAGSNYISTLDRRNVVLTPAEIRHRLPRWLFKLLAATSRASAPAPTSGPR